MGGLRVLSALVNISSCYTVSVICESDVFDLTDTRAVFIGFTVYMFERLKYTHTYFT